MLHQLMDVHVENLDLENEIAKAKAELAQWNFKNQLNNGGSPLVS